MAETRDLKVFMTPANPPVSGFPLSAASLPWVGLSALAQPRLTMGGQPYLETRTDAGTWARTGFDT